MKVPAEQRKRQRTPKVRTGCKTCKIRRIKCGEQRPECQQCSLTGRKCDGYELQTSHWTISKKPPKPQHVLVKAPISNTFRGEELRSLEFFLDRTSAQIGSPFSLDLWAKVVPLLAQSEASVKHCILALSKFHETFTRDTNADHVLMRSGLQHYNFAIRQLTSPDTLHPSPIVGLLCCILFFAIELLQGKLASAVSLFESGRRVLYELRTSRNISFAPYEALFDIIKAAYIRLEYHVSAYARQLHAELDFETCYGGSIHMQETSEDDEQLPTDGAFAIFNSIPQAREELRLIAHKWVNHGFSQHRNHRMDLKKLKNWCLAFDTLKATMKKPISAQDRKALAGLEYWWRQVELYILTVTDLARSQHPLWWDQHEERLKEILNFIEIAFSVEPTDPEIAAATPKQRSPTFCLETGIVTQLLSLVFRCRNPFLRRRAVAILRACNSQEGLIRRDVAVDCCERLIELEERGRDVKSAADIPIESRVVAYTLRLHPNEPKLTMRYSFREAWVTETFCWEEFNPTAYL